MLDSWELQCIASNTSQTVKRTQHRGPLPLDQPHHDWSGHKSIVHVLENFTEPANYDLKIRNMVIPALLQNSSQNQYQNQFHLEGSFYLTVLTFAQ